MKYGDNRNTCLSIQDFPSLFPNAQLCHKGNVTDAADKYLLNWSISLHSLDHSVLTQAVFSVATQATEK